MKEESIQVTVTSIYIAGPYEQKTNVGLAMRYKIYINGFTTGVNVSKPVTFTTQFTIKDSPNGTLYLIHGSKVMKRVQGRPDTFAFDLHYDFWYTLPIKSGDKCVITGVYNSKASTREKKVFYKLTNIEV